ncbi:hypothetical protein CP03DC29_0025B, partial [Chlamydia psittaci 03DC29]
IRTVSSTLILLQSHPERIFTVTGIETASMIFSKIFPISSGDFNNPDPLPSFVILSVGQPQFKSIKSKPRPSKTLAASPAISGLLPQSCPPMGRIDSEYSKSLRVREGE